MVAILYECIQSSQHNEMPILNQLCIFLIYLDDSNGRDVRFSVEIRNLSPGSVETRTRTWADSRYSMSNISWMACAWSSTIYKILHNLGELWLSYIVVWINKESQCKIQNSFIFNCCLCAQISIILPTKRN